MRALPFILAAIPCLVLLATRLLGGAAGVSVLSGTDPGGPVDAVVGLLYAASFFGAILIAPPLALLGAYLNLTHARRLRPRQAHASLRGDDRAEANREPGIQ